LIFCLTAIFWVVSHWCLKERPGFNPKTGHIWLIVNRVTLGCVFFQVLQFSPANYHSTNAPYSVHSSNTTAVQSIYLQHCYINHKNIQPHRNQDITKILLCKIHIVRWINSWKSWEARCDTEQEENTSMKCIYEIDVPCHYENYYFWGKTPCNTVDKQQHHRATSCLHLQGEGRRIIPSILWRRHQSHLICWYVNNELLDITSQLIIFMNYIYF